MLDISKLENVIKTTKGWTARCPACAEDGHDKEGNHLSILSDGRFNCIKYSNDSDHNRQIISLAKGESGFETSNVYEAEKPKIVLPKEWPVSILDGLSKDYSYWIKRGIPAEICQIFSIGVAHKGQMYGRSVIPIFNSDRTKIIGFTGRKIDDNKLGPKWKHLSDKKLWIFGGNQKLPKTMEKVILVESPVCIMKLYSYGIKNTLCLFGINISSKIISYLIQANPKEILISTNNEPNNNSIGNIAAQEIKDKLASYFLEEKIKIALPIAKDFGDQSDEQMLEWIKLYNVEKN